MMVRCLKRRSVLNRVFLIITGAGLALMCVAFIVPGPIQREAYMGAEYCGACHQEEYKAWSTSAHHKAAVHCESCHGPGQYYAALHIKKDAVLSNLLFKKEKSCLSCHSQDEKIGAITTTGKFDHARSR